MEAATYLTVAAVLVVAGALLRTVVLNWVVGPARPSAVLTRDNAGRR